MTSTLTTLIFLHYKVATKMALEILGYTMSHGPCVEFDYDGWSAYHLKYLNWYMLGWRGWSFFSRKSTVRVLVMDHYFNHQLVTYNFFAVKL